MPGLFLEIDDERPIDTRRLSAALLEPGTDVPTGVQVAEADVWGGLGSWLALTDPDMARLSAIGEAVDTGLVPPMFSSPGQAWTTVILGDDGLAALVRPEPDVEHPETFEVAARPLGPGGPWLAQRLAEHVAAWHAAGRPSTADLRIRAYPDELPGGDDGRVTIEKRHIRLVVDWL